MKNLQVGQIVQILMGREAGEYAIVINREDPSFVWLADGRKRSTEQPKRKNVRHIQPTQAIGKHVVDALQNGILTNEDIRSDVNQYLKQKGVGE